MSDLTLESAQTFSSSINSSCDAMDVAVKSIYSVFCLMIKQITIVFFLN